MEPPTQAEKQAFITRVAAGDSIVDASGRSESLRRKLYRAKDAEPDFAAEWVRAYQEGTDTLTAEARRRAVDGWDEPVFHKGEQVATIRKYDSGLLMFLIRQRDPSYRDNAKLEVTGSGGGPVQVEHRGVKLSDIVRVAREAGVELGD